MIQLPKEVIKSTSQNPRRLVLFAQTKAGKTRAIAGLKNALIIDTEEGTEFIDGIKIDLKKECRIESINPMIAIQQISDQLTEYHKKNGTWPYDYIIIDTVTEVEEFARTFATFLYKTSPIGKSYAGSDVVADLPNGGGCSNSPYLVNCWKILKINLLKHNLKR
jgi:hypothetical protein